MADSQEGLLSTIASWFHKVRSDAVRTPWLSKIIERIRSESAIIVSFNWDLVLDELLFEDGLGPRSYGLGNELTGGPALLKPHGSLNWYGASQVQKVAAEKHVEIFPSKGRYEAVEAFLPYRQINSTVGRRYVPLIVPPTYLKDFDRPIFQVLWNRCTDVLSTSKELIFLGYSLPVSDLHAHFIFRCGFHNQIEGRLGRDGKRQDATGPAKVTIVNPDQEAAKRIEAVAGPKIRCEWIPRRIGDWLENRH